MSTNRTVPFFNYPATAVPYQDELLSIIQDVFKRGAFILQKDLEEFEAGMKKFLGVKHAFGVADGTNAIALGLRAAGIRAGDEVIIPSHTFIATAAAVHFTGAQCVLADCGPDHLIDPASIEKLITSKTKAIVPVHLNGRTCNMDPILRIARDHGLQIVEDAAQAFGSRFKGKSAGSFGTAGTFSFYPAKILGCFGDGGGVITNDDQTAEALYALRDHGRNRSGEIVMWGTNSRLDNLHAAILNFKLARLPQDIERRRQLARLYHDALHDIEDLVLPPAPDSSEDHFDVYQNYEIEAGRRAELQPFLAQQGIRTLVQWGGKAIHQLSALNLKSDVPKTERLFQRCFMLPMNTSLSDDDINYVTSTIRRFYGRT